MVEINYTYPIFRRAVKELVSQIKANQACCDLARPRYNYIVGIGRGSAVLALVLSHRLNLPLHFINWSRRGEQTHDCLVADDIEEGKKILVVDEIIDSGKTLKEVLGGWGRLRAKRQKWPTIRKQVDIVTLVYNVFSLIKPDYYYTTIDRNQFPDLYVDFWWEKK